MAVDPDHGHQRRFAEWVRDHGKAVRGFLLALVRRGDVADDLCQEVFCRAWQARERYTDQGKTRAYLLQIANRLVVRSQPPQRTANESQRRGLEDARTAQPAPEPSQAAMLSEQVGLLHAALDRLAPMQQRVLLLRYYGQMDFQEIADTLETPLNTALSHCRRGLETLRRVLVETHAMNDSMTNQDNQRLKQMLEEVTAADTSVRQCLRTSRERPMRRVSARDAEGASLREAWLAFGRLIRAADASLPAVHDMAAFACALPKPRR